MNLLSIDLKSNCRKNIENDDKFLTSVYCGGLHMIKLLHHGISLFDNKLTYSYKIYDYK
jgi:hypothetical protein